MIKRTPDKALRSILEHDPRGNVSLVLGDCLDALANMPPQSAHLLLTDPPYFLDSLDADWDAGKPDKRNAKSNVVGGLPAGMRFDRRQGLRLQAFYSEVSKAVERVLVPGGFFLSFASPRLYHRMAVAMDDAGFELRDMLVWYYCTGGQAKAFTQDHFVHKMPISKKEQLEIIQSMDGRKTPQIRPQFEPIAVAQKPKDGTFVENWQKWQTGLIDLANTGVTGKTPTTVFAVEKPTKDKYNSHLTVKPVNLLKALIKIFSKQGQTVIDPFVGSGSTLLAARSTERIGIGIEINPVYHQIATDRIRMANQ